MDTILIKEIVLWTQNSGDLYNRQYLPICKNLQKKHDKGTYDHDKARKLWGYMADTAVKDYVKQNCSRSTIWHKFASKAERREIARILEDEEFPEIQLGNYR